MTIEEAAGKLQAAIRMSCEHAPFLARTMEELHRAGLHADIDLLVKFYEPAARKAAAAQEEDAAFLRGLRIAPDLSIAEPAPPPVAEPDPVVTGRPALAPASIAAEIPRPTTGTAEALRGAAGLGTWINRFFGFGGPTG
jgi:hypothetical protein